jgi:hypothetical protein
MVFGVYHKNILRILNILSILVKHLGPGEEKL